MALKSINISATTAKPSKGKTPVIHVNNNLRKFNQAARILARVTAVIDDLKPAIIEAGQKLIFKHNTNHPNEPWTSVKLENTTVGGRVDMVRVDFKNSYKMVNADAVVAGFADIKDVDGQSVDENLYVHETVKASFDSDVFLKKITAKDNDGTEVTVSEFSPEVYAAFKTAIDAVATRLNVPSPLSSKTIVVPRPEFHQLRWAKFNDETQAQLQAILPAVVAVSNNVK